MWNAVRGWFKSALDGEGATASKPQVTLAKALARDWLEVWYQPKVDLQSNNQVVGAEALIRVRHPQLGVLGPGAFLPGASTADMLALTEHVLAKGLDDWNDLEQAGWPELKLAVNVPVSAFAELPIAKIVRRHRPSDDRWPGLILEVTEDQAISDLEMANEVAQDLQAQNCSLAIDDFGAGYSSLARLRQLPFSELKIDRAYVTDCHADRTRAGVLESVIDLARRFGLKSVAEGIESARESHKLQGLGCNLGQGFYFAKPMAKSDFIASLPRRVVPRKTVERGWWRSGRALKPSG
jgi:EAL domain-containing protein (putative c-di-GMP-specific phosphodiesterase class I)